MVIRIAQVAIQEFCDQGHAEGEATPESAAAEGYF